MNSWIDFLPLLALFFVMAWVTIVHRQCLRRLRQTYKAAGVPLQKPSGIAFINAWAVFQPQQTDTSQILEEKEMLRAEAKRRLRFSGVIFFLAFFGLAIVSMILKPLFH